MGAGAQAGIAAAVRHASPEELKAALAGIDDNQRARLVSVVGGSNGRASATNDAVDIKSTELQNDLKALGVLVAEALKPHGWGTVDRTTIQVKENSGEGGSKTYKVSAVGGTPSEVALHSRMSTLTKESEARTQAAARVFGDHGLSPKRLAEGVDWFIEPWEGCGEPTFAKVADMEVLGKELAKVHKMPIDWFDSFRVQIKDEFPVLADVPDASHIWWYSCRMNDMFPAEENDPVWLAEFVQPQFTPQTMAGARIVTCHGDLKEPNMISLLEGGAVQVGALKFVDLEFAHVTAACYDLAYVCFHYEDMPEKEKVTKRDDYVAMRRAFLKSYLEAMGDPSTEHDVDALLVDTTLAACGHHFGIAGQNTPFGRDLELLKRFKGQAAELLASEAEQAKFRGSGPEGWLALQGYAEGIQKECGQNLLDAFKHFRLIVAAGSSS